LRIAPLTVFTEDSSRTAGGESGEEPLLAIDDLAIDAAGEDGMVRLIEGVSLAIRRGEVLGLVGESGCGKSVTALSILRILPQSLRIGAGTVRFEGQDLSHLDARSLRSLRGGRIGMIFQEPMTSLNPTFTVGWQLAEALRLHGHGKTARKQAIEALRRVGIGGAERRLGQYPHELSGGLRQRVMIAMALACRPQLLIADEPTTALDVTIQKQILDLLARLRRELGMAVLLVSHDLGVIAEYADRISVMYAGRVVEHGKAATLLAHPHHPYTAGLLAARPSLTGKREALANIPGTVPSPSARGVGCRFADRCARALHRCRAELPAFTSTDSGFAACWNPLP
jgi:oligopeptide/dipeptide ABC transporter ATP-binding protein